MANYSYSTHTLKAWRDNNVWLSLVQGEGLNGTTDSNTYVKSIKFQLKDDNGIITLPLPTSDNAATAVSLAVTLPNGTEALLPCEIRTAEDSNNGIVYCPIKASLTQYVGEAKGEIRYITSSACIKFYGIVFNIYKGVSNLAAIQSDQFELLVIALSKVQNLTGDGEITNLGENISSLQSAPVAGSVIYNYLLANYYNKTNSDDRYYQKTDVYTKTETNVALAEKANIATTLEGYGITNGLKYVNVSGNDSLSVNSCISPDTIYRVYISSNIATHAKYTVICVVNDNKIVQYAFTRHGFIMYRGKSGDDDWEDWDYLPTHSLMSKAIREAVISGFFGIETDSTLDKTYNVHNADVDSYYNKTPYTNDNFEHSHIDESFETLTVSRADRPNTLSLDRPSGATKIVFRDTITQKEWSETVSSSTFDVKNLIPSHLYYYTFYNLSNKVLQAGKISPIGQIRMIDAGGNTFNIRDLGGWTCDGGKLKYGLIYRGCRLNGTDITLTSSQILFFKDTLGIRDEIDLRSDSDATGITDTALGIGVDYVRKPLNYYQNSITADGDKYAFLIKRIAQNVKDGKVSYIHCASGADRTAQLCMIIEAVCGVAQTDFDRDYELTSFAYETNNSRLYSRRRNTSTNADWKTFIGAINNTEMEGITLQDKVIRYLIRNGVTIDEINALRFGLIDGNPTKITNPYSQVTVTKNLSHVFIDSKITSLAKYQPYEATLAVDDLYMLTSITITMGGNDAISYYNNGKISIPIVTGDIVISATAIQSGIISDDMLVNKKWNFVDLGLVLRNNIFDDYTDDETIYIVKIAAIKCFFFIIDDIQVRYAQTIGWQKRKLTNNVWGNWEGSIYTESIQDGAITLDKLASLVYESTPNNNSTKLITSGGIYNYILHSLNITLRATDWNNNAQTLDFSQYDVTENTIVKLNISDSVYSQLDSFGCESISVEVQDINNLPKIVVIIEGEIPTSDITIGLILAEAINLDV